MGLAVTYYFDSPGNVKLLTILAYALRLIGLSLVYCQSAAPEISCALAAALVSDGEAIGTAKEHDMCVGGEGGLAGWLAGDPCCAPSLMAPATAAAAAAAAYVFAYLSDDFEFFLS